MSASCETDQRKLSGKNKVWILCISNCSFKWQDSTCEMEILFCKFKVGYLQVVEEKAIGFKPKCEFDAYVCAHSPWIHPLLLLYLLFPLVFLLPLLLRLLLLLLFLLCANVQSSRHLCVYLCVGPKTDGFDQKRLFLPPLAFLLAPPAPIRLQDSRNGKCCPARVFAKAFERLSSNSLENFRRELAFVCRPLCPFQHTDYLSILSSSLS